jgi:hypothetical protein
LRKEGRLFEDSSKQKTGRTMIDQTTSGLNFVTTRPRIDILRDFLRIESVIYDPKNYFKRVTYSALRLKWFPKYRPGFIKSLKTAIVFLKLSGQLTKIRSTAWPYYKMLLIVLFRNPGGIEPAVNLSAMFIHFHKQSKFIIKHITQEIETVRSCQEEKSKVYLRDQYIPKNEFVDESVEFY